MRWFQKQKSMHFSKISDVLNLNWENAGSHTASGARSDCHYLVSCAFPLKAGKGWVRATRKAGVCENRDLEPSEPRGAVSRGCWKQPARYQPVASGCLCWGVMWFSVCVLANVGCTPPRVTQWGHGASSVGFSTQSAWGPEVWWVRESTATARVDASNSPLGLVCGQLLTPKPCLRIIVGDCWLPSTHARCISDSRTASVTSFCGHGVSFGSVAFSRLARTGGWHRAASGAVCLLKEKRLSKTGEFCNKGQHAGI